MTTVVASLSVEHHANKLIEVYLNWILSNDTAAGWHQPSMLQSMIEFKGCMPPPSGNDQADLKMIREVEYLRKPHALLSEARELIGRLPSPHKTCLLIHERTAGTYDRNGKRWTERRIAAELGMTVPQYRHYRHKGKDKLLAMIRNVFLAAA